MPKPKPLRGEVWWADMGFNAKVRPVLVLSVPFADADRALFTVVLHTTSVRGTQFEVAVPTRFLRPGAFDAQNIQTVAQPSFERKLGTLTAAQMLDVEAAVRLWLGL